MIRFKGVVLATLLALCALLFAGLASLDGRAIWDNSLSLMGSPNIDVCTQRGGEGSAVTSPPFCPDEEVILYAMVTYSDYPEQNKFVAFQISNPSGNTYVLYGTTNGSGVAATSFRLPLTEVPEELGAWRILATVDVAETIVDDTVEFQVRFNLGDVDGDLSVDIFDVVTAGAAYGSSSSDPHWNVNCDVSAPYGFIDLLDLVLVAGAYGQQWSDGQGL